MQAQDRPQPKPGPAPSININKPQSFVLKNGLKVLVVENHKLPRVSFNLTLDNAPYAEGSKKGVSDLLSSMIGNGTQSKNKDAFNEEIDFLGANINFYASGASANGLSRYSKRILELMADGALNPLFVQEEFDKEKAKIIEGLKSDEKSVTAIARRVENVLTYGKDHYKGEFTSEETLKNVTLEDVINNYDGIKKDLEKYNRDKNSELIQSLKEKDITKLNKKQLDNVVKFLNNVGDDEKTAYLLYILDNIADVTNPTLKSFLLQFEDLLRTIKKINKPGSK
jgi:hypothetical protein